MELVALPHYGYGLPYANIRIKNRIKTRTVSVSSSFCKLRMMRMMMMPPTQPSSYPRMMMMPPIQPSSYPRKSRKIRVMPLSDIEKNVADMTDEDKDVGGVDSWVVKAEKAFNVAVTDMVIYILDSLYAERHYARFYVLETIARVPYFAFVSVLHMYESFGWWRRADYLKIHFAESWNELHHLLVMEALGGDERWFDRFLAQHIAVAYFFLSALMYTISPRMAYNFSECVERHAYSTYDKFINQYGEELKNLPAPEVAVKYYQEGDLYMFDEFQTDRVPESRRPKVDNLYDVFVNIRADEWEHCKTMHACQVRGNNLKSPHTYKPSSSSLSTRDEGEPVEDGSVIPEAECSGIIDCLTSSSSFVSRARKRGVEVEIPELNCERE